MWRSWVTSCFLIAACGSAAAHEEGQEHIRYLVRRGHAKEAIGSYLKSGLSDLDLVQDIALQLLWEGASRRQPETQLIAVFGAGISMDARAAPILARAISSPHPQIQLAAINLLAQVQDQGAGDVILSTLSSNFWPIRLQAAHALVTMGYSGARAQIESLLSKSPPPAHPLLVQLLTMIGDRQSMQRVKQAMMTGSPTVRRAAILSAAQFGRDDLLPELRIASSHFDALEQEACAVALGWLHDAGSVSKLDYYVNRRITNVSVAANQALHRMGRSEAQQALMKIARDGNPYAITALSDCPDATELLAQLCHHPTLAVRVNAGIALLAHRDSRCLPAIREFLLRSHRDIAALPSYSPAGALKAWRTIPSARQNLESQPYASEMAVQVRERMLLSCSHLSPECFLELARDILQKREKPLVPMLVHLLEDLGTPQAVELLKTYANLPGAPLVRTYCQLALVRLAEPGPYREMVRAWALRQSEHEMIQFRPVVPWEILQEDSQYLLTPKETSRLLVDSFQTLAEKRDIEGITTILEAIRDGHESNRYALAGLLLQAAS